MITSQATLRHERHALLASDSGKQALQGDCHPALAGGGVEGLGEGHAEHAVTQELMRLMQEVDGLRRRLLTQPTIEQAKGLLIGFYGVDADTAFAILVRWSQHTNTKLNVLAAGLVAEASQSPGQPHAGLRRFIKDQPDATSLLTAGASR